MSQIAWIYATTLFIFIMGLATVCFSLFVAKEFYMHRDLVTTPEAKKLIEALWWQLIGEAVLGLGTLTFSVAAHFEWLENWSIFTQSALRFFMFAVASFTTLHLWRTVKNIIKGR